MTLKYIRTPEDIEEMMVNDESETYINNCIKVTFLDILAGIEASLEEIQSTISRK